MAKQVVTQGRRRSEQHAEQRTATSNLGPILAGQCVVCDSPLHVHFKEGRWVGCTGKRRAGDALFVPPMTILLTPGTGAIIPETFTRALTVAAAPDASVAHDMGIAATLSDMGEATKRTFKTIHRTAKGAAKNAAARGRTAYLYFVAKAQPKDITEGDAKVYKLVASHKKGMLFKDIVSRTKLPASTADWARIRLMKAGALVRKPATA